MCAFNEQVWQPIEEEAQKTSGDDDEEPDDDLPDETGLVATNLLLKQRKFRIL